MSELLDWKSRIDVAIKQMEEKRDKRDVYKNYYRGIQWNGLKEDSYFHATVDNVVFPNIRAIVPKLNFRNPKIFVSPKKKPYKTKDGIFDTVSSSMFMEILLNYYYKELEIKRESRRCLYDALLGHWGVMEIGYTVETEKVKSDGELLEVDELIKSESLFVKRRSPDDLIVDVEGTDHLLNDRRWIGLRWVKPLSDVKSDPKFSNTKNLKSNFTVNTDFSATSLAQKNDTKMRELDLDPMLWERVVGWTIWDKKTHKRFDVVENHNKFLSNDKWPAWTEAIKGFPVEILYMNENPDEPFPLPDIEIYKKTQDEINLIGSMQMSHIKRISERRYLAKEDEMDETEERKLQVGGDGTIVHTRSNPEGKLIPLQDAGISQDIYMIQRLKKQEISEESGVSGMDRQQINKFDTATEPALISASSRSLRDDQRGLFEDFLCRVVRKMAVVIQQTSQETQIPLSTPQVEDIALSINNIPMEQADERNFLLSKIDKITGQDGNLILQPWLTLSAEDIKGEYNFDIEVGSTQPINEETRKRDVIQLAQILQGNPWIRTKEFTVKLLEAFNEKEIDKLVKSPEEVQQEQEMAVQAQQGMTMAEKHLKSQTDIAKTMMKTQSSEKISNEKNRTTVLVAALQERKKE